MSLTPKDKQTIENEEQILTQVVESIDDQIIRSQKIYKNESTRARELTAMIVNSRNDEDKQLIASDEAVSHAMSHKKIKDLKILDKARKKPYFARFEVEEIINNKLKTLEYKLGYQANSECRIIDWRKAPVSKLYYEYKEGEEYFEQILDKEREGKITLRNSIEIENSKLKRIATSSGSYIFKNDTWEKTSSTKGRTRSSYNQLPDILSLITADQFQTITKDAGTAILIQGIAGSGKTTVALHRLAWLLHEDNSTVESDTAVVIVKSRVLKNYIKNSIPQLADDINPNVFQYDEWTDKLITQIFQEEVKRAGFDCPRSALRLLKSIAFLACLESIVKSGFSSDNYYDYILETLKNNKFILNHQEGGLFDQDIINQAEEFVIKCFDKNLFHQVLDPTIIRIHQLKGNKFTHYSSLSHYGHIVLDEAQDFSPIDLSIIIASVKEKKDLTIVGDSSQQISANDTFPGWEKLIKYWDFNKDFADYLQLNISHRSTKQIMTIASFITKNSANIKGRAGRVPLWMLTPNLNSGIKTCIRWLNTASKKYPDTITAVLCPNKNTAKEVFGYLEPTFGNQICYFSGDNFDFDQGILVADIETVKGLEFFNVLIWNPSQNSYPDMDHFRNLLYVGITRAEENLGILSYSRISPIMPTPNQNLFRIHDIRNLD